MDAIRKAIEINVKDRISALPDGIWLAEPDLYRIALELDYLAELDRGGWWGDNSSCMYAETLIQCFGPIVRDAAITQQVGGEMLGGTITLLNAMRTYMHWQLCVASDWEDAEEMRLTKELFDAVERLGDHLKGKWDKEATEAAA